VLLPLLLLLWAIACRFGLATVAAVYYLPPEDVVPLLLKLGENKHKQMFGGKLSVQERYFLQQTLEADPDHRAHSAELFESSYFQCQIGPLYQHLTGGDAARRQKALQQHAEELQQLRASWASEFEQGQPHTLLSPSELLSQLQQEEEEDAAATAAAAAVAAAAAEEEEAHWEGEQVQESDLEDGWDDERADPEEGEEREEGGEQEEGVLRIRKMAALTLQMSQTMNQTSLEAAQVMTQPQIRGMGVMC
jgi:hypothetical protein